MTTQPFVVITSINPPTAAVRAFASLAGGRMVVVGDRKSPQEWSLPGADFLAAHEQGAVGQLAAALPWNHYCRKMLGYLYAARRGAEVIYDTDDDNAPKENWHVPDFSGAWPTIANDQGWVNVYRAYTDRHIWPRGFPLRLVTEVQSLRQLETLTTQSSQIGVWQALADGDPDVDAIYRLVDGRLCDFDERPPLVLDAGTLCPFNSQATAFSKACFPLLYLPTTVTMRVTDILRGFVAQPILWAAGLRLGFTSATVRQERNPHDLLRDFGDEIPLYLHTESMMDTITGAVRRSASISENLMSAYEALARAGTVAATEPALVETWLADLERSHA